jgi:ATP-dependent Zn protease
VDKKLPNRRTFSIGSMILIFLAILLIQQYIVAPLLTPSTELSYSDFKTALRAGKVASVSVSTDRITGKLSDGKDFTTIRVQDQDLIKQLIVSPSSVGERHGCQQFFDRPNMIGQARRHRGCTR